MVRTRTLAALSLFLASASSAQTLEDRVRALEQKAQMAPAGTSSSPSAFNPAMGLALDMVLRSLNGKGNFEFRAAELNLEAPVDPHLKAWVILNATPDEVEAEEATLQTTSLPGNLTVRGGRLFADFGRLAHFHDHELPFIGRPTSLQTYIGGEARGDGLEVSWLSPLETYFNVTLGAYNRLGAENARRDDDARPWDEFTYMARAHTALEPGDDHALELGVNSAWTPKRRMVEDTTVTGSLAPAVETAVNTGRTLTGVDLTYRWQPAAEGLYKGATWSTEGYRNDERRFNETTRLPGARRVAYGGYSYLEAKLGRSLRPGAMVDLAQDPDSPRTRLTRTYLGYLTWNVTEFQRLRTQYARRSVQGRRVEDTVSLQWTAVLGHHVHGFRDR